MSPITPKMTSNNETTLKKLQDSPRKSVPITAINAIPVALHIAYTIEMSRTLVASVQKIRLIPKRQSINNDLQLMVFGMYFIKSVPVTSKAIPNNTYAHAL